MKLPLPKETLAGCVWLPRIFAKARLTNEGELESGYSIMFCHSKGVDGQFLGYFSLNREDVVKAAIMNEAEVCRWFLELPTVSSTSVAKWNEEAINFGRTGFPMSARFPVAMATSYKHLAGKGFETVFEVLEADEMVAE